MDRRVFVLLLIAACRGGSNRGDPDDATPVAVSPASVGLTLDREAREKAGIETARLGATTAGDAIRLTGTLIADPSRVTVIEAPIAGRLAVIDGGRWPAFGERVAAGGGLGQGSDAQPL